MAVTRTIRSTLVGLHLAFVVFDGGHAQAADLLPPSAGPIAFLAPAPAPFFVRLGATGVLPDFNVDASIAGNPVAGGNGRMSAVPAAYVEAGYYVTRHIAASISGGFPPTFTTKGIGTLASQGVLYRAVVGLPVFSVTYHLDNFGPVRPYAGVGIGYGIVFRNESAAIFNPLLRNEAAFVVASSACIVCRLRSTTSSLSAMTPTSSKTSA